MPKNGKLIQLRTVFIIVSVIKMVQSYGRLCLTTAVGILSGKTRKIKLQFQLRLFILILLYDTLGPECFDRIPGHSLRRHLCRLKRRPFGGRCFSFARSLANSVFMFSLVLRAGFLISCTAKDFFFILSQHRRRLSLYIASSPVLEGLLAALHLYLDNMKAPQFIVWVVVFHFRTLQVSLH